MKGNNLFKNIQIGDYIPRKEELNIITLIDKERLLNNIVNLKMPIGISSQDVDATYMGGYCAGKRQREIVDEWWDSHSNAKSVCIKKVIKNQNIKPITDTSLEKRMLNV